jgi:dimethylglycine dehydrogenase
MPESSRFTIPTKEREAALPGLRRSPVINRMKAKRRSVQGRMFRVGVKPNWFLLPKDYALSEDELARPDVLLSHNHPDVVNAKW